MYIWEVISLVLTLLLLVLIVGYWLGDAYVYYLLSSIYTWYSPKTRTTAETAQYSQGRVRVYIQVQVEH